MSYKFFSLITALLISIDILASVTDSVTVTGKITGLNAKSPNTVIVDECDPSEESVRLVAKLDSAGNFSGKIPFSFPHTFFVSSGRKISACLFAEPGDSIHITVDASTKPPVIHISGDRAELNEEYTHAYSDLSKYFYSSILPPDTVSLDEYMPAFKTEVAEINKIIDEYIAERSLSDDVANLLRLDCLFNVANSALGFRGRNEKEAADFLIDPFFDIFNEDNAKVMIFPCHLSSVCLRDSAVIGEAPKGIVRDIMMVKMGSDTPPDRDSFANPAYYDRVFGSPRLVNLDDVVARSGSMLIYHGDSIIKIDDAEPIKWLLENFGDKDIYLDISATWCGPCRSGLMAGTGVRDYFKDKNVVFAVLWLKSNVDAWKKIAPSINNSVQIFIQSDELSDILIGDMKVQGFPTYHYINCGEVVTGNVPGYHSPDLIEFIDSRFKNR